MRLDGRAAIVTGAGRGIGRGAALRLAAAGASVALVSRTRGELDAVASEIERSGGRALPVVADVSSPEQTRALAQRALEAFGRIDVLVNNAGLAGPRATLDQLELADWDAVLGTNLRGTMLCAKAVLPAMLERASGSIINVSSLMGRTAEWGRTHYCASKWGVIGFTQALAHDVGRHGIRVNCVVPGLVHTEVVERYLQDLAVEKQTSYADIYSRFAQSHPTRRIVRVEEVAELMLYLASDASGGIHGQSIDINAGYWMS
jgi:NAD(P)-dependent dehydrogenase (short-subunit alcohol dehydrogenase family)